LAGTSTANHEGLKKLSHAVMTKVDELTHVQQQKNKPTFHQVWLLARQHCFLLWPLLPVLHPLPRAVQAQSKHLAGMGTPRLHRNSAELEE
jgi:hypothetical protein